MWRFIVRPVGTRFLMTISAALKNMQLPGSRSVKIPSGIFSLVLIEPEIYWSWL